MENWKTKEIAVVLTFSVGDDDRDAKSALEEVTRRSALVLHQDVRGFLGSFTCGFASDGKPLEEKNER